MKYHRPESFLTPANYILRIAGVFAFVWFAGTYLDVNSPNIRIAAQLTGLFLLAEPIEHLVFWLGERNPWAEDRPRNSQFVEQSPRLLGDGSLSSSQAPLRQIADHRDVRSGQSGTSD